MKMTHFHCNKKTYELLADWSGLSIVNKNMQMSDILHKYAPQVRT